jgi:hypothetical protein
VTSYRVHDRVSPVGRDGVLQPGGSLPPLVKDEELAFASSGIWAAAVLSQVLLAAGRADVHLTWLVTAAVNPVHSQPNATPSAWRTCTPGEKLKCRLQCDRTGFKLHRWVT